MQDISQLSVIIPVYRNAATLNALINQLTATLTALAFPYELVFVVDACPEGSLGVLRKIAEGDTHIRILALDRNMGQNWAILMGLAHARGDVLVTMDADLQDPPHAIPDLIYTLDETTSAVFAGKRGHYEAVHKLLCSAALKRVLHWSSGGRVPLDAGLFMALKREMVDRLLEFRVQRPYVTSLMGRTGLVLKSIPVTRAKSLNRQSGYTLLKRLRLAWQALSCSRHPTGRHAGAAGAKTIAEQIYGGFDTLLTRHGS